KVLGPQLHLVRLYLREPEAAWREKALADRLRKDHLPVPQIEAIGDYAGQRYAVVEWKNGQEMRQVLLAHPQADLSPAIAEAAFYLASLQKYRFPHAGFLNKDLAIATPMSSDDLQHFVAATLRQSF